MATINLTPTDLTSLAALRDQGTPESISAAWGLLGRRGDAYGFLASAIVSNNTASMSTVARAFYELVKIRWNNTPGAGLWGDTVFTTVAKQHLTNYINMLTDPNQPHIDDTYTLPNTKQIEASYKQSKGSASHFILNNHATSPAH